MRSGPYAIIRHPNYAVTIAETFLLPAVFGAWAVAFIMTAVWAAVLRYKIELEDAALAPRQAAHLAARGIAGRGDIHAVPRSPPGGDLRAAPLRSKSSVAADAP